MKTTDDLTTLSNQEKKAIAKASEILKQRFQVKEVILFGSKARGDDDTDSDIDLLLLTEKSLHWKERQAVIHELFDIEMAYEVVISILDTTVSEWKNGIFTVFPIHQDIMRDGVKAA